MTGDWPAFRLLPAVGGWEICDFRQARPNQLCVIDSNELLALHSDLATGLQLCWQRADGMVAFNLRGVTLETTPGKACQLATDIAGAITGIWQRRQALEERSCS